MSKIRFKPGDRTILEQIVRGTSAKEIAFDMIVTESTVNHHIRRICRRAGVSRYQLVIYVLQHSAAVDGGETTAGLHPDGCPCAEPYCRGRRKAA